MKYRVIRALKIATHKFKVRRTYKDKLFRCIFRDKKDLLNLYNALNGTNYTDPDDLYIVTLEDVLYIGMRNDVAFVIAWTMNLYEHQSTMNPNMPLRGFLYFAATYQAYIDTNKLDIYGTRKVMLPMPRYVVFYNGTKEQPDKKILKLSDAFVGEKMGDVVLECQATMLNINYGHNKELMKKCKRLSDYSYFIQAVRDNINKRYSLKDAINRAVDECIEKGVLEDILRKNRAEVFSVVFGLYNKKLHEKTLWEEGREEGREEGIRVLVITLREIGISKEETIARVEGRFLLQPVQAEAVVEKYWESEV